MRRSQLVLSAALLLVACAGNSSLKPYEESTQLSTVSGRPHLAAVDRKPLKGVGGVFTLPRIKYKKLEWDATLGYAPSSLGKHKISTILSDCVCAIYGLPPPPNGLTVDWEGVVSLQDALPNVVFDNANLALMISSTVLSPSTSYTLLVYIGECDGGCGNYSILSQSSLGMPVGGQLTAPSPLEDGFDLTQDVVAFQLAH